MNLSNKLTDRVVQCSKNRNRIVKDYFHKRTTQQKNETVIKQALEEWSENHPTSMKKDKIG